MLHFKLVFLNFLMENYFFLSSQYCPLTLYFFLPYFFTMTLKNLRTPGIALLSNGEGTWQSLHCYLEKGSEDNLSCFFFEELQDLFGKMSANVKNPTLSTPILAGHCFTNGTSSISAPLAWLRVID